MCVCVRVLANVCQSFGWSQGDMMSWSRSSRAVFNKMCVCVCVYVFILTCGFTGQVRHSVCYYCLLFPSGPTDSGRRPSDSVIRAHTHTHTHTHTLLIHTHTHTHTHTLLMHTHTTHTHTHTHTLFLSLIFSLHLHLCLSLSLSLSLSLHPSIVPHACVLHLRLMTIRVGPKEWG